MLANVVLPARLLHVEPQAIADVAANLHDDWRREALDFLRLPNWRHHTIACAAMLLAGVDDDLVTAAWHTLDLGSWAAPQIVATTFFTDAEFAARTEERLMSVARRPPKTIGALIRAYHRLPKPRMNVIAQLSSHDALLQTEEGRIGIRGVDEWFDRMPLTCSDESRARWCRDARALAP
jgi:hypothetical protein